MLKRYRIPEEIWKVTALLIISLSITLYAQEQPTTEPVADTLTGQITLQTGVVSDHPIDVYIFSSDNQFIDRTRTNLEGGFEITVAENPSYRIIISSPLYRPVLLQINTSELPIDVMLAAGDLDGDGCIMMNDLRMMTYAMNNQNLTYDLTGDDMTNVQDLTVVSHNYDSDCVPHLLPQIHVSNSTAPVEVTAEVTAEILLDSVTTMTPTVIPEVTSEVLDVEVTEEVVSTLPAEATEDVVSTLPAEATKDVVESTEEVGSIPEAEATEDVAPTPEAEATDEIVTTEEEVEPEQTSEPKIAQTVTATEVEATVEVQLIDEVATTPTAGTVTTPISATASIQLTEQLTPTITGIMIPASTTEEIISTITLAALPTITPTATMIPAEQPTIINSDEPEHTATVNDPHPVTSLPSPSATFIPTLESTTTFAPTATNNSTDSVETAEIVSPP
jgi:hypothetical protein